MQQTFEGTPQALADLLACRKAEAVSCAHDGVVIGADQVLCFEANMWGKVSSQHDARRRLKALRGKTHSLHTQVVLAKHGKCFWSHGESSYVSLRPFSDRFLDVYLQQEGEAICESVGCYRLEGLGAQLISRVRGDFFSVLGLPLLPLLEALREEGVLGR